MFELPVGLPSELVPLSWLIGVWEGSGVLEYKIGEESVSRTFGHRLSFSHDGLPYPRVSATASLAPDQSVTVTLAHTDPAEPVRIELQLAGRPAGARPVGRLLTAPELTDCNTPAAPDRVAARPWDDFRFESGRLTATLPPACLAAVTFR